MPDRPGWGYGLVLRLPDGRTRFYVGSVDGRTSEELWAGPYLLPRTCEVMGVDPELSWERVAQKAVDELEAS